MRRQVNQFAAMAGLTALETLRQPFFLLVATACLGLMALLPLIITQTLGEAQKMVRDAALSLHLVCGLVLGAYAACATLHREIRRGIAAAVLSKPVSRTSYFLAKYAGVALILTFFSAAMSGAALMAVRVVADPWILDWHAEAPLWGAMAMAYLLAGVRNYFTRRSFAAGAAVLLFVCLGGVFAVVGCIDPEGVWSTWIPQYAWNVARMSLLIHLAILVLSALAFSLATRLDTVPTLCLCSTLFLVGLMSDYLFGRHADHSLAAALLYLLVPNWQHFWVTDALNRGVTIPAAYLLRAGAYALLYAAGTLGLGLAVFRRTEVKA